MIPGIDPKIDIAFKKLFGSEEWAELTASLINAVIEPAGAARVTGLELLNPYTQNVTLDDKLSILDIKVRDAFGRLFNVEMQMISSRWLPRRLLYYWSKLHSQQLSKGDDYSLVCPTISICFVNSVMFPDRSEYHWPFRLRVDNDDLHLTDDLTIHVIEIPKFPLSAHELKNPLDIWLYFLKNGDRLDGDALPRALDVPFIRRALEVLKMLSQNDYERELYEGRIKYERDQLMRERDWQECQRQMQELEQGRQEFERQKQELEQGRQEFEQQKQEFQRDRQEFEQDRREFQRDRQEFEQHRQEFERDKQQTKRQLSEMERRFGEWKGKLEQKGRELEQKERELSKVQQRIVELQKQLDARMDGLD